jgi:hypothetical protein
MLTGSSWADVGKEPVGTQPVPNLGFMDEWPERQTISSYNLDP